MLAYLTSKDGGAWFVRRRFALPLEPGAVARSVPATRSDWGESDLLQLGDQAPDFELPRADGTTVALSSFKGRKNVVITTYRAFW